MDLPLQQIFDRARAADEWIPAAESELLFGAAVRLAAEQGAPLRPARILLGADGELRLAAKDDGEDRAGYLAPELAAVDPPRRTEGRVQVFAAGALGYELLTGRTPPAPPAVPGPELTGPLGDLVRVALCADRRERFGDLQQLLDAVEVIHPRRPALEKEALAGLYQRVHRWEALASIPATAEKVADLAGQLSRLDTQLTRQAQTLGRLAEQEPLGARVAALEAALAAFKAQQEAAFARLAEAVQKAQAARAAAEQRAREDAETREALAALHPKPSPFLQALVPALLGGALAAGAMFLVMTSLVPKPAARAPSPAGADPAAAAAGAQPGGGAPHAPGAAAAGAAGTTGAPAEVAPAPAPSVAGSAPAAGGDPAPAAAPAPSKLVEFKGGPAPADAPAAGPSEPTVEQKAAPAEAAAAARPDAAAKAEAPAPRPEPAAAKPEAALAKAEPAAKLERGRDAGSVSPAMIARSVARSQVDRGDSALEKGKANEAIDQFRAALENDPELASAHRGLGMAFALKNLDAQARREYEKYLEMTPNAEDAADIRKAIEELRQRSKLGGDDK